MTSDDSPKVVKFDECLVAADSDRIQVVVPHRMLTPWLEALASLDALQLTDTETILAIAHNITVVRTRIDHVLELQQKLLEGAVSESGLALPSGVRTGPQLQAQMQALSSQRCTLVLRPLDAEALFAKAVKPAPSAVSVLSAILRRQDKLV